MKQFTKTLKGEEVKFIFSKQLAEFLCGKGHELLGTVPNMKDRRKKVFLFDATERLEEDMSEYIANKK